MDWKKKLTSRKFWMSIVAAATPLLVAFGVDNITAEQVELVVMGVGGLIAYIVGEGFVDGMSAKKKGE